MKQPSISLWFQHDLQEVLDFYQEIFKDNFTLESFSQLPNGLDTKKTFGYAKFAIKDMQFEALDANFELKFNETMSVILNCDDQDEIDYYWEKLSEDGSIQQCGWLKDKFGLSWQVLPHDMAELMQNPGAMEVMYKMKKIEIAGMMNPSKFA